MLTVGERDLLIRDAVSCTLRRLLGLKLALPMVAFILIATAAVVIFVATGVDLWAALVVAFVVLLLVAWYLDRRDKARSRYRQR